MDKETIFKVGGDLESALKGEYQLAPKAILKEAWLHTQASRKVLNLALLTTLLIGLLITLFVSQFFGGIEVTYQNQEAQLLINIVITICLAPLIASLEMMGVLGSVGLKTDAKFLFSSIKKLSALALCSLLTMFIVSLGIQLLVLPGLYLLVALSLTLPLIVSKGLSPIKAIVVSIQATRFQWLKIFIVYFALFIVLLITIIPLVLLLNSSAAIVGVIFFLFVMSYLAPMFYYTKGILYREIFGLELAKLADATSNSTFSA
ncbi:MAG: hypothetical protein ACSHW0_07725 [Thalassotalea sp.]